MTNRNYPPNTRSITTTDGRSWSSLRSLSRDYGRHATAASSWLWTNPDRTIEDLISYWETKGYSQTGVAA